MQTTATQLRLLLSILAVLVAASAAVAFLLGRREAGWTTDSPRARAELEQCLEDAMRFYHQDARIHCERAVALDPELAVARLYAGVWALHDEDPTIQARGRRLLDGLESVDLGELSPRERLLVRYRLLELDGEAEQSAALLDDYLERHPDDPYALDLQCQSLWERQEWDAAESCFHRLLETDPNWVEAQNRLGYLALAASEFEEAEELFQAYGYIAPDQANPHDSMGELLTLVGRYEEAERELRRALEVRPDFCPSWQHLVQLFLLIPDLEQARSTLEELERLDHCPSQVHQALTCQVGFWERLTESDWDGVWRTTQELCTAHDEGNGGLPLDGEPLVFAHRAALETGRAAEARALSEAVEELVRRLPPDAGRRLGAARALAAHMRGAELLAAGRPADAADAFARADRALDYWGPGGLGTFKLFNRMNLAAAYEASGERQRAQETWHAVDAVNPRFARATPQVDWTLGPVPIEPPASPAPPFTLEPSER